MPNRFQLDTCKCFYLFIWQASYGGFGYETEKVASWKFLGIPDGDKALRASILLVSTEYGTETSIMVDTGSVKRLQESGKLGPLFSLVKQDILKMFQNFIFRISIGNFKMNTVMKCWASPDSWAAQEPFNYNNLWTIDLSAKLP